MNRYKVRAPLATLALLVTVSAVTGTAIGHGARRYVSAHRPITAAPVIPVPTPPVAPRGPRYVVELPDCESDTLTLPCVTYDESEWRIVYGFKEYTYQEVSRCPRRIRGKLPCVLPVPGREAFRVYASTLDIG